MTKRATPEELYPNLFGKQPEPSTQRNFKPADLRLLQWAMQSHANRSMPEPRRSVTPAAPAARFMRKA